MAKLKFKKQPLCEVCGAEQATSFSYFPDGKWRFTGACTSGSEKYYVMLDRFFSAPMSTVDWMAHLHEKGWFKPTDFFAMFHRFREATQSFESL